VAYVNHWGGGAEIYVKCSILEWTFNVTRDEAKAENLAWSIIAHELGHALGLDHAKQMYTDDGHPELMYFGGLGAEKVYYSTLDLHALYIAYFGNPTYHEGQATVTLPENLEYKMIIPHDVQIQKLKDENKYLWNRLKEANDLLTESQEENRKLRAENENLRHENEKLRQVVQGLDIKIQLMQQVLDRCQADRERLDKRVTELEDELKRCHDLGMELARKCNETIKDLVSRYNSLNKNYSLCLNYLKQYREAYEEALEETQFRYKMLIYLETGIAMAIILAIYVYARKHGIS